LRPSSPQGAREGVDSCRTSITRKNIYAAGRIPGGYFKREGRPTEKKRWSSRLIDARSVHWFGDGWRNEPK